MAENRSDVVADGADDIELLRRMRFKDLAREFVIELKAWAQLHGFDIHANHVWGKVEWDGTAQRLVPMVQIHGLCARAHGTGEFAGVDEPVPTYGTDGSTLLKTSVTVYRIVNGVRQPFTGTAYWREYYPGPGFWDAKPEFMLGKCALAIALRWAFPAELGGCYLPEELEMGSRPPAPAAGTQPAKPEVEDNDLPNTPMQLALRLVDYGLSDPAHREKVVAGFRVKLAHLLEQPRFYAEVFKAVRARPEQYGGRRPEAA